MSMITFENHRLLKDIRDSIGNSLKMIQTIDMKRLERQNELLAAIAYGMGATPMPGSWAEVRQAVRAGEHTKIFSPGDAILTTFDDNPAIMDVIGLNHDIPSDPAFENSLTVQFRDCLMNAQFSAPQALWYANEELPAGIQRFTQDGSELKYAFTTTKSIPIGGQVVLNLSEYIPVSATTYAADRVTVIESGLPITEISSGTDTLLDINVRARVRYGSNNYLESAIRQWLNSEDETFQWQPQTPFDRPSNYGGGGFLHRLDPELAAVIGPVNKQVARNTITDEGGQDVFNDKVFLLSRVEVYGGTEGITEGEMPYVYYENLAPSPTTAALDGRIKVLGASARTWWLRSPNPGSASAPRSVSTGGQVSNNNANYSRGAAPDCCIW